MNPATLLVVSILGVTFILAAILVIFFRRQ
jgi:hypothetical protein